MTPACPTCGAPLRTWCPSCRGRLGAGKSSPAKAKAARKNAKRPRPRRDDGPVTFPAVNAQGQRVLGDHSRVKRPVRAPLAVE